MSAHSSTVTVPEIVDVWRRTARTALQVGIPAFITLAGLVPLILDLATHLTLAPKARMILVAVAGAITAAAAGLARLMAVPAVNQLLDQVGLGGISTVAAPLDTETRAVQLADLQAAGAYNPAN